MSKTSVIIAVYNTEKYLRQCLDSVVNQTLRDIEIICVNDASTDNSLDILNEYAVHDKRVKVVSKENEGLGAGPARNLGLTLATGKYISILDSDDFFELDMLEKMFQKAEETNADIVLCDGMAYDNKSGIKMNVPYILEQKAIPEKTVFSYKDCPKSIYQICLGGVVWNKLYRHEFISKHNIHFQGIKYTDDLYFTFISMVFAEKITAINEQFTYYRINTGSAQSDGLVHYLESVYIPFIKIKESLVDLGIYEIVEQSFVNNVAMAMRYFYDKVETFESFEFLHEKYKNEIFRIFNINERSKDYFYDERVYQWQKQVSENSAGKLAWLSARSFGAGSTTATRFQIPLNSIPANSRIVIFGAGLMGRLYYSQLLLSFRDVVLWCDILNPKPSINIQDKSEIKNMDFDLILIAYAQQHLIKKALDYLSDIGVPNEKIIFGGTGL